MKTWVIVVIAILVLVLLLGVWKMYSAKDTKKVTGGQEPSQEDINCATGGQGAKIIGMCTKPIIDPRNMGKEMRQKCFTSEQLLVEEGQSPPDKVTDNNGFGTTWYFNYQNGDNFCYRSPQWLKGVKA